MKKKVISLIAASFIGIACFAYFPKGENNGKALVDERNQKIYEVVKKDLSTFLEIIPAGFETQHGFNNRAEFAKAIPGGIYTIVGINENGKTIATDLFNIPVIVDNQYKAMITVSFTDGKYELETVGAAMLAAELQILEKQQPAAEERIMLNVYSKTAGFVAYKTIDKSIETADFIPLTSAKTALNNAARTISSTYKLAELVAALNKTK